MFGQQIVPSLNLTIKGNIFDLILYMYCHLVALNTKREPYKICLKHSTDDN